MQPRHRQPYQDLFENLTEQDLRRVTVLPEHPHEFVPAALICHRGKTHDTGHYFAILIYRDLMWLADDGKVPTYLPFLTPKLASQITQIWAVSLDVFKTPQQVWRGLPPPEEPDYDPPLHPSPPKKARKAQAHNKMHYANVTNFGRHRSLTGTGPGKERSTFSLKRTSILRGMNSSASTSAYGVELPFELQRSPTVTPVGPMVGFQLFDGP